MLSYIFQKSFFEHEHFYYVIIHSANLETNFHVSAKKTKRGFCGSALPSIRHFLSLVPCQEMWPHYFVEMGGYKGFVIMTRRWERTFIRKNSPTFPFSSSLLRSEKFPQGAGAPGPENWTRNIIACLHLHYAKLLHWDLLGIKSKH